MEKRHVELDVISGILILCMLFSHASIIPPIRDTLIWTIFYRSPIMCIIPWFFFKSGMLFSEKKTERIVFWGGVNRLLIPFAVFAILGQFLYSAKLLVYGEYSLQSHLIDPLVCLIKHGYPTGNLPLWFLLTLFVVRIMFKKILDERINLWLVISGCFIWAFVLNMVGIYTPFYLGNVPLALMYYSLGYKMKLFQFKNGVGIMGLISFIAISIFNFSFIDTYSNTLVSGLYPLAVLSSLSSIVVINNVFKRFKPLTVLKAIAVFFVIVYVYMLAKADFREIGIGAIICYAISALLLLLYINNCWPILKRLVYPISLIGRDSMVFFICHWPLFWVCDIIVRLLGISDNWFVFDVRLLLFIILLPLFRYVFTETQISWMVGNQIKDKIWKKKGLV